MSTETLYENKISFSLYDIRVEEESMLSKLSTLKSHELTYDH